MYLENQIANKDIHTFFSDWSVCYGTKETSKLFVSCIYNRSG